MIRDNINSFSDANTYRKADGTDKKADGTDVRVRWRGDTSCVVVGKGDGDLINTYPDTHTPVIVNFRL